MEESKMELAIAMMLEEVNIYSRYAERAKVKNLPMEERDYLSRIIGIDRAIIHLGWKLEEEEERVYCKDGETIVYTHYRAIKR